MKLFTSSIGEWTLAVTFLVDRRSQWTTDAIYSLKAILQEAQGTSKWVGALKGRGFSRAINAAAQPRNIANPAARDAGSLQ
jgi:hypothetical protein